MAEPVSAAARGHAAIAALLDSLDGETRQVGPDEWGFSLDVAGWPMHVGVAVRGGLVRAQGEVAGPGALDPGWLLRANRHLPLARFAQTNAGSVWVIGELPSDSVTVEALDGLLGVIVHAAAEARQRAAS